MLYGFLKYQFQNQSVSILITTGQKSFKIKLKVVVQPKKIADLFILCTQHYTQFSNKNAEKTGMGESKTVA